MSPCVPCDLEAGIQEAWVPPPDAPLASLFTLPESLPQPSPCLADSLAAREGGGTKGLARGSGLTEPEESDLDSPLSPRWRPFAPVE